MKIKKKESQINLHLSLRPYQACIYTRKYKEFFEFKFY
jgi:hypothetical protein